MKLLTFVIVLGIAFSEASMASESYMVVRLADKDAVEVVTKSGAILVAHPDLKEDEVLVLASDKQLDSIQNEPKVVFVYPASIELIAGVPVHSCTPSTSDLISEYILNIGKGWNINRQLATRLTYSVQGFTPKMGKERTLEVLAQAFAEWSKYVQIEFTYSDRTSAPRNLNVLFASGAHGDSYPFDGPRRTLAHTFYPADVNPEPIAGDLHFDEDENWGSGVDPDFHSVALHEIGHALGLGHSDRPSAVMYPYYRRLATLLPDDIAAIRRLYPSRQDEPRQDHEPPRQESPRPQPSGSDSTAPTLRVLTPSTTILSTSAATARISGTALDVSGVEKVTWTASGGRSGVANGTATWTIPDLPLRTGDNSIVIRAYDTAGNTSWRNLTITRR